MIKSKQDVQYLSNINMDAQRTKHKEFIVREKKSQQKTSEKGSKLNAKKVMYGHRIIES